MVDIAMSKSALTIIETGAFVEFVSTGYEYPVVEAALQWNQVPDEATTDWTWNGSQAVPPLPASIEDQRGDALDALKTERARTLAEDGVVFTNAVGTTAKYRLNQEDQKNITGIAFNGDPAFTGVTKTSLDQGEVVLNAQDCLALASAARQRVIVVVNWYKAQKAAIEASENPATLMPFQAP